MTTCKLDSHHHLWHYVPEAYPWMGPHMEVLKRDFLASDFVQEMRRAGIDYSIAVQASETLNETRFLLNTAKQSDFIKGVVGWVPLIDNDVEMDLEHFAADRKLRAVRHILHDEEDEFYMLREDFNRGISLLMRFGLTYDILIYERHLPQTIQFVDWHPDQRFVVDHLAKPRVRDNEGSPWQENVRELARRPNVYCKLSGLATEAEYTCWSEEQLGWYMDVVLEAFGPNRVMFGSDWPVCLLAIDYAHWVHLVGQQLAKLSASEQERIWWITAAEAYQLSL